MSASGELESELLACIRDLFDYHQSISICLDNICRASDVVLVIRLFTLSLLCRSRDKVACKLSSYWFHKSFHKPP